MSSPETPASPTQSEILKAQTPAQRLRTASQLLRLARELKHSALHQQHPDWDEIQLKREVARLFLYART